MHLVSDLYKNELDIELSIFNYFGIKLKGLEENNVMTRHEKIKEMMSMLNKGYAYLDEHYSPLYDIQNTSSWFSGFIKRELSGIKNSFFPQPKVDLIDATNLISNSSNISEDDAHLVWNLLKIDANLATLFNQIHQMKTYGEVLSKSDDQKGSTVKELACKLTEELVVFITKSIKKLPTNEEVEQFKSEFSNLLHSEDEILTSHREIWKPIVVNIFIALTGIGFLALLIKAVIKASSQSNQNKQELAFNDYFFFAKTNSQILNEQIEESLNGISN